MPDETQAVQTTAKPTQPVLALLQKYKQSIEVSLPKHLRGERMMRVIVAALTRTPDLLKCEPITVINSVMHLSQLGLEPRPGEAYLIPFNKNIKIDGQWKAIKECVPVIDYRGKAKLARQSGLVKDLTADVVYSKDHFKYKITQDGVLFEHEPARLRVDKETGELIEVPIAERGKMVGAFAIAYLKDSDPHVVFMTRGEISAIRAKSRSADSGPWAQNADGSPKDENDWNEQAKKTAVHRLCKMIPQSVELAMANELDDRVDAGLDLGEVLEAATEDPGQAQPDTGNRNSLQDRVAKKTKEKTQGDAALEDHKSRVEALQDLPDFPSDPMDFEIGALCKVNGKTYTTNLDRTAWVEYKP